MKLTCGTREAHDIEFMFCVSLFLKLSYVVFGLSFLTIDNFENGTWKPKEKEEDWYSLVDNSIPCKN